MQPYYDRARATLAARPVPDALHLLKVQALETRARQLGQQVEPLDVAVNFHIDGLNPYGMIQRPCTKCGDCVTGCNFSAKNTLYMNYLPLAVRNGADIFTQTKVEWIEKLAAGGWRIHGQHYTDGLSHSSFTLDARNVVLSAGAVNSTEILLRSEMHGLKVSPLLGTQFSGNGDFVGLAYNGDRETDVLGYGNRVPTAKEARQPGPSIVGAIRYNAAAPLKDRITVEDFSFPSAYAQAAKVVFAALRGDDTTLGNEVQQGERVRIDFDPGSPNYSPHGALNHTMLYLVMGQDNARGTMKFEAPWNEPDGRMTIEWDRVGQQVVFTRMNEELRRHARALGASFIQNPTWSVFRARHLITAHPLGGCPMGEDYLHGAVDQFGRVFSNDGSIQEGLFVCDGALIPSALGVNPFLTISAISERIAERKIRQIQGDAYPKPNTSVSTSVIDPLDVLGRSEAELEKLFRRSTTLPIERIVNRGAAPQIDIASRTIRNDVYWKGFFPKGNFLETMSSAIFTGFKKAFSKEGAKYTGVTSDTDGRIRARNSLEEVTITKQKGSLEPGRYILLRYLDPPWTGYYDTFKLINDDLLIGRVYLGDFPNGIRVFTFAMTRKYSFNEMTAADHHALFAAGAVPAKQELDGVWRMDIISNNNHMGSVAYLRFELKPDGRLESTYQLLGLIEGFVIPSFTQNHFQLNDFTPFHDEIRKVDANFMAGRYVTAILPDVSGALGGADLGIFHSTPGSRELGFYYTLTRAASNTLPIGLLLQPFLDVNLPDGLGMTFDEQLEGWYFEGAHTDAPGRAGDLPLAERVPAAGNPKDGVPCVLQARMTVRDINEFVDGFAHEAAMTGSIRFGALKGQPGGTFAVDGQSSTFNYLMVNPATKEAEMRYHVEFMTSAGKRYVLEGRKYMHRTGAGGVNAIREVLYNYTTLYCHVFESEGGALTEIGTALLKFRTFEDLAAVGSTAAFLASFTVTGTNDPLLRLQGQMRFLAFTAQFVQREYDPLSPDLGSLSLDVQGELLRGAVTPDYFSSRATGDLQTILHDAVTQPLEKLVNTRAVTVDVANRRIHRDLFWKGSFAKDSLLGLEERVRNAALGGDAAKAGALFTAGAFWKRFDRVRDGVATGRVVNYDLDAIPGDPEVRAISYPDNNRRYFRKGDNVLLLRYRNAPYQQVYDTIKIVDDKSAIGVMHLGEFPNGVELATFVMERYSYSFEDMSIEDHQMIFSSAGLSAPVPAQLTGNWRGNFIVIERPNTALLARKTRTPLRLAVGSNGAFQVELEGGVKTNVGGTLVPEDMRALGQDTVTGQWKSANLNAAAIGILRDYVEPYSDRLVLYYVLRRA
ncbi:MAG: GMC family oxidoreductase [Bryobacterales bacterium]|nr:GMC family oxidoreductase [Bryobacterales bacterium]